MKRPIFDKATTKEARATYYQDIVGKDLTVYSGPLEIGWLACFLGVDPHDLNYYGAVYFNHLDGTDLYAGMSDHNSNENAIEWYGEDNILWSLEIIQPKKG